MSTVPLDHPITVQQEVLSSSVEIIEVSENYVDKMVFVRVKTSDAPLSFDNFKVWGPDNYNIDWTQSDLEEAILSHYDQLQSSLSGDSISGIGSTTTTASTNE